MDIYKGREFVEKLLNKHQISMIDVEETNNSKYDGYYDRSVNKIFFNFKNIKESAIYFGMNLDDYFEIITCHEIGHIIDLESNENYYNDIYDECKQEMNVINYSSDTDDYKYKKIDEISIKLKNLETMREVAAWEKGVNIVRDDLIEKYNNFAQEAISQLK